MCDAELLPFAALDVDGAAAAAEANGDAVDVVVATLELDGDDGDDEPRSALSFFAIDFVHLFISTIWACICIDSCRIRSCDDRAASSGVVLEDIVSTLVKFRNF